MARILASPASRITLTAIGDSQTDPWTPYSYSRADMKWPGLLAAMLAASYGLPIKARNFGISGQTSADLLARSDVMQQWEAPDVAAIAIGVNDPGVLTGSAPSPYPTLTAVATGGSIAGGYVGVAFVVTSTAGQRLLVPPTTVQVPAGTTGSFSVGALSGISSVVAKYDVYLTPSTYSSVALALAASTQSYLFSTSATVSAAATSSLTVAALPASGAMCPSVSTQANIQALIKSLKYGVVGLKAGVGSMSNWVAGPANLPANAPPLTRMIVMDDTSATGGMAAISGTGQHATIAGNFSGALAAQQTVWERRTPQAGPAGWGRVAVTGTPVFAGCCARLLVVSTNYLNFASSTGDNVDATTGTLYPFSESGSADNTGGSPTFYAAYKAVRAQQAAAVAAENAADAACLYVDLFAFQSALIASGETSQGSNAWHWAAGNQHHNAYGHDIVARACLAAITAGRPAWLTALLGL